MNACASTHHDKQTMLFEIWMRLLKYIDKLFIIFVIGSLYSIFGTVLYGIYYDVSKFGLLPELGVVLLDSIKSFSSSLHLVLNILIHFAGSFVAIQISSLVAGVIFVGLVIGMTIRAIVARLLDQVSGLRSYLRNLLETPEIWAFYSWVASNVLFFLLVHLFIIPIYAPIIETGNNSHVLRYIIFFLKSPAPVVISYYTGYILGYLFQNDRPTHKDIIIRLSTAVVVTLLAGPDGWRLQIYGSDGLGPPTLLINLLKGYTIGFCLSKILAFFRYTPKSEGDDSTKQSVTNNILKLFLEYGSVLEEKFKNIWPYLPISFIMLIWLPSVCSYAIYFDFQNFYLLLTLVSDTIGLIFLIEFVYKVEIVPTSYRLKMKVFYTQMLAWFLTAVPYLDLRIILNLHYIVLYIIVFYVIYRLDKGNTLESIENRPRLHLMFVYNKIPIREVSQKLLPACLSIALLYVLSPELNSDNFWFMIVRGCICLIPFFYMLYNKTIVLPHAILNLLFLPMGVLSLVSLALYPAVTRIVSDCKKEQNPPTKA